MRRKLSVCVVTYNEERNIERCLRSVSWADEIVVVDSFSQDRTVEIALKYTDRVYRHPWGGYGAQKNLALGYVGYDWVLALDADEEVSEELGRSIREVLEGKDDCDGYEVARRSFYLGRWIGHGGWYPDYQLRLFRKGKGKWMEVELHERVVVEGEVGRLKGDLYHYPYQDLSEHIRKMDRYSTIASREMARKGIKVRGWDLLVRPLFRAFKSYVLKAGFLDGVPGLVIALSGAAYAWAKYSKLWELQNGLKGSTCGHGPDVAGRGSPGALVDRGTP